MTLVAIVALCAFLVSFLLASYFMVRYGPVARQQRRFEREDAERFDAYIAAITSPEWIASKAVR